jgi:uncharacterized protein (DUF2147 family)
MKRHVLLISLLTLFLIIHQPASAGNPPASDCICGKWESTEKNLIVLVYKEHNSFMAKIIWFKPSEHHKKMEEWTDIRNPDEKLRERKILGMDVLEQLRYDPDSNSWEDGMIYDAKNGRHWNASGYINKEGLLKVKGYWHFKFIGRTLTFTRV